MAYVFEIALSRSMNTYHKWSVCSIYSTYTRSMSKMRTLFACMLSLASASKDRERWPIYTRRTWCFYIFCNNICGNILRNKHVVGGNTNRVCFCYQTYVVKLPRKKQQRIIVCVHLELFFYSRKYGEHWKLLQETQVNGVTVPCGENVST